MEKEVNEIKKNGSFLKTEATSLTVLLITVFLLAALSGTQFIGKVSAVDYAEYTGTIDSADWALRIPDPWNGMLVMVCRGGSPTLPDPLSTLAMLGGSMLNQGFAVAASNYGAVGWPVAEGVESTYQLTNYILENETYGVTGRVFLYGGSLGGGVALLLGEKYPDIYSGVLDASGIKDMKHLYTHATTWGNMTDEELTTDLTELGCPVPPPPYGTLQEFRDGLVLLVGLYETVCGGTPETNPAGYEALSPTYHANIQIPVITVHGTADPFVPYVQSLLYQTAVAEAYRSDLYRLYPVSGGLHGSADVMAEIPARFNELVEWSNYLTGVYDWPMFAHDPQRTGCTDSPAPSTNQTLWTSTVSVGAGTHTTVADDKLFIGAWDNRFYCFDATNGTQIWNYTTGGPFYTNSAYEDGRVYLGSTDNTLYCLNASTGASIWNYTMDDWAGAPAIVDGRVYAGSDDYNVYCLNATTGAKIWNYTTGGRVAVAPAVADGLVYVGSNDYNVYCLNATTGAKIWNYITGANIDLCSPAVAYGNVYVGSADDNVYCLNATTGTKIWNYTTGSQVYGSPAVADGKVYATSLTEGILYCLNAYTGAFICSYDTSSSMLYSGAVVANGVVYVVSGTTVYAIPESYTIAVVMLLSIVSVAVSFWLLRKNPKWKNSLLEKP